MVSALKKAYVIKLMQIRCTSVSFPVSSREVDAGALGEHPLTMCSVRPWGKGNPSQKPKVSSFYEIKGTEPVPGPLAKCWTVAWTLFPSTVLFLRSHQVVADDSCFTYSSCLFPLLDLQIFSTLMFVPGFDKALRCLTCVGNFFFFFLKVFSGKKKRKGSDSIPKPSFIPSADGLHLLLLRSLSEGFLLQQNLIRRHSVSTKWGGLGPTWPYFAHSQQSHLNQWVPHTAFP